MSGDNAGSVSTSTDSVASTGNLTETDGFYRSSPVVLDPAEEYSMTRPRRGVALIFNQERFFWRLGLNNRSGTNADRYNLERRFVFLKQEEPAAQAQQLYLSLFCPSRLKELNFDVRSYDDYKLVDVLEKIHEAAEEDHSDADCFLLAFFSHGEDDHVYAYDGKISIQDITAMFKGDKCQSLVGKPKIFVVQACRGEQHDVPVTPCDAVDSDVQINETVVDACAVQTLPAGADFIMCYSVAEGEPSALCSENFPFPAPVTAALGYYSHRETINGSWYIQDLCELLQTYGGSLEFTELLTLVNRKVSMRRVGNCNDRSAIGKKQVPCFASMLTKKLYFRPKK
ncbi:hypothetical protein CCH79_00009162 [Gambusia affinis]|uniref:Caspase-6 n=1 Tax=Gambusia affinis TaxID=33528 RepID=A0A315WHD8_GAMAF|nr:hypothetical protein CCH79_00009162 [Gambusia affinis]